MTVRELIQKLLEQEDLDKDIKIAIVAEDSCEQYSLSLPINSNSIAKHYNGSLILNVSSTVKNIEKLIE